MALLLGVGCRGGSESAGAPAPIDDPPTATVVPALVDRVWMRSDSTGLPGVMRIFLSDSTLVMDSCWETYRLARWQMESDTTLRWRGMRNLGTLGGPTSAAQGISETGVVVGSSTTAAGREEAFLWTRGRGMRSLGTLGGNPSIAMAVNTHRRVVGNAAEDFRLPFLWTAARGMRQLPTLGGGQAFPRDLNEFGQIAGSSVTAGGALRAALWTPTAGPFAVAPTDEGPSPEAAAQ